MKKEVFMFFTKEGPIIFYPGTEKEWTYYGVPHKGTISWKDKKHLLGEG